MRALTRKLQKDFEKKLAREIKINPKAFWRYTNSKLKTRTKIGNLLNEDGSITTTSKEKADVLNKFFSSVFTEEATQNIPTLAPQYDGLPLDDIDIQSDTIKKKLLELKISKAAGPDGWHPRVLNELAAQLCEPLSILLRKSLDSGQLPDIWKMAHVVPIHKKGSRSVAGNYRPVSLTAIIAKVFESLIRDALVTHMMDNGLFADEQHGFVPGRSCMTQLLLVMEEWTKILENGTPLDVIYLDFRKAFDSVPHQRLIKKLQAYGIKGKLLDWITGFLTGRRQRVIVDGHLSDWAQVTSGIPQGSVLGPILFVIFINDMPSSITSICKLFADDAKVYRSIATDADAERMQGDLDDLEQWADTWQMGFNTDICKSMHLGATNPHHIYKMNGNDLIQVREEKDLGVKIYNQLKFHAHSALVVNKAFQILAVISKSFACLDEEIGRASCRERV
mgnify:CR=1 FL=1